MRCLSLLPCLLFAATISTAVAADTPPARIAPEPAPEGQSAQEPASPESLQLPARAWELEPAHSSVSFSVSHLGFSRFTAGFDEISATLTLDPEDPEAAQLVARIPVASLDLPGSTPDFLATMLSPVWFDAEAQPEATYVSSAVRRTGTDTAEVTGILTIRNTEAPLDLFVRFNGGYPSSPFEPYARIGFSAQGTLSRSALGMDFGVPAPGTTFGVGDSVEIQIEAEFIAEPAEPE